MSMVYTYTRYNTLAAWFCFAGAPTPSRAVGKTTCFVLKIHDFLDFVS